MNTPNPTDRSQEYQQDTPSGRWLPATIAGRVALFVTGLLTSAVGMIVRDFLDTYRLDDPATGSIIAVGAIMVILALIPFRLHGRNRE